MYTVEVSLEEALNILRERMKSDNELIEFMRQYALQLVEEQLAEIEKRIREREKNDANRKDC